MARIRFVTTQGMTFIARMGKRETNASEFGFALPSVTVRQVGEATWTLPRTLEGHPDLQGVWANNNATPLVRLEERAAESQ